MYVCMYVCMYVGMYVCICCMYVYDVSIYDEVVRNTIFVFFSLPSTNTHTYTPRSPSNYVYTLLKW